MKLKIILISLLAFCPSLAWSNDTDCRKIKATDEEKQYYSQQDNIFAIESVVETRRIECIKGQIKQTAIKRYGEPHWENIQKQLVLIEKPYIEMYRTLRCPTWPDCPNSGAVFPLRDYYSLLNKLLWDLNNLRS